MDINNSDVFVVIYVKATLSVHNYYCSLFCSIFLEEVKSNIYMMSDTDYKAAIFYRYKGILQ